MAMPQVSLKDLLDAGVHFGHRTQRWNPKMRRYIYGERNKTHIIDLRLTVPLLEAALKSLRDIASRGGRVLFVGTKRQAQDIVKQAAESCGQYYVNHRWLGGMLTNWQTVSNSIRRLNEVEKILESGAQGFTKRERLSLQREFEKLNLTLGGIREMGGLPDAIFVIDVEREHIAIHEADILNIPVFGIVDTNADPECVTFPIPGNDDAARAIALYSDYAAQAVLDGISAEMEARGVDLGAQEAPETLQAADKANEDATSSKPAANGEDDAATASEGEVTVEQKKVRKAASA